MTTRSGILMSESLTNTIGPINLDEKLSGKRSAGNLHAAFDEAGAGNVAKEVGLRTAAKAPDNPPTPKDKRASSRPYHVGRSKILRVALRDTVSGLCLERQTTFDLLMHLILSF